MRRCSVDRDEGEAGVLAAEAERIGECGAEAAFARHSWHIVEIAGRIWRIQVDGRRNTPVADGEHANGSLYGVTALARQMPGMAAAPPAESPQS